MSHPVLRLLPVIAERRGVFAATIATNLLVQLGVLAVAVLTARIAADGVTSGLPGMTALGIALAAAAVVTAAATSIEAWLGHDLAYGLITSLRSRVFDAYRRSLPDRAHPRRTGDLVRVALADADALEWLYAHTLAQGLSASVVLAVGLVGSALISPWLLLVTLPLLVATAAIPWVGIRAAEHDGRRLEAARAELNAEVIEVVQGLRELSAGNALGRMRSRLAATSDRVTSWQARIAVRQGLERAVAELVLASAAVGALLVALLPGGGVPTGSVPVMLVLVTATLGPVAQLSELLRNGGTLLAVSRRLADALDRPAAVTFPARGRPVPRRSRRGLEFREVSFRYGDASAPALDGVSFVVRRGERVALVGPSGAGKTSCARLAVRTWDPAAGEITVNGVPLPEIDADELPFVVSAVPQEPGLLRGTVESNIRLGRPDASESEVAAAAEAAGIRSPGARFGAGLATPVGEHGAGLSGGQRARVAIARALLMDPLVLVLDEATANLDDAADDAIGEVLAGLDRYAVLVVAHRPSTIARCDRVISLRGGRVQPGV
ncbi:ABC transporter ATP-binding protein [Agromyces mediolanus]|uniref:ABC transporter n=1 Tax=Agromyces mediolanus TaxID=41986 RepID=A0A918CG59_AGRME|nr:ABC transporter ATP-binding protein [Agromyces mediolanus]GGR22203.1 ABC transporter [Agromyces mediolanus]GLJ73924.1 ABC transporter [Agromyces mediolanus]